jgi:hypothetical protein
MYGQAEHGDRDMTCNNCSSPSSSNHYEPCRGGRGRASSQDQVFSNGTVTCLHNHFITCQPKGLKHTSLITIQPQSAVIKYKQDSPKLMRYRFAFQKGSCNCLDMALLCTAISLPRCLLTIWQEGNGRRSVYQNLKLSGNIMYNRGFREIASSDSEARFCRRKSRGQLMCMVCLSSSTRLREASQKLFIPLLSFHNYITPQYWFLHATAPSDHLHPQQSLFPRSKSQHLVRDHS